MSIAEEQIYDITIIGGGPVGLFATYYAGLRGAKVKIIEALEELGGALIAIYPEKYIYDIAGFPAITARDYVEGAVQQAMSMDPDVVLNASVTRLTRLPGDDLLFELETSDGNLHYSRTVIISGGIGAFEPKKLEIEGMERFEGGKGVHYFAKRQEDFRDKDVVIVGGGDSAVDWANTLTPIAKSVRLIHRSKFRAHAAAIQQMVDNGVQLHYPEFGVKAVHGDDSLTGITFGLLKEDGQDLQVDCDELIVAIGFLADLGPVKTWGLEVERNTIAVDIVTMQTNIPGVFACGDIASYPAKFKLIASGAAEAVTAVNHCVTLYDPEARLDPGHSTNIMEKRAKAEAKEAAAAE